MELFDLGKLPVLTMSRDEDTLEVTISIQAHTSSVGYVAISHVWLDGLGNPRANILPRCQWKHLSLVLSELLLYMGSSSSAPINVWIDTICCPLQPLWAKDMVLSRMREIYETAACILVLDLELEQITLSEIDLFENVARVFYSSWMTRLWTLQEAYFADVIIVRFKDGFLDLDSAFTQLYANTTIDTPRNWLLRYSNIRKRIAKLPEVLASGAVFNMTLALSGRSVAVPTDEPICLATLLDLDVAQVLECEHQRRMIKFWQLLGDSGIGIPNNFLFCTSPKLTSFPFRWAPSTLLSLGRDTATSIPTIPTELTDHGLKLQSVGFLIDTIKQDRFLRACWHLEEICVHGEFSPDRKEFCEMRDSDGNWISLTAISQPSSEVELLVNTNNNIDAMRFDATKPSILDSLSSPSGEIQFGILLGTIRSPTMLGFRQGSIGRVTQSSQHIRFTTILPCISMLKNDDTLSSFFEFAVQTTDAYQRTSAIYRSYVYKEPNVRLARTVRKDLNSYSRRALRSNTDIRQKLDLRVGNPTLSLPWFQKVVEYVLAGCFHFNISMTSEIQTWILD